ncbi:hypothetical protein C9374_012894 [Naegleria lovaniensis]|uniref:Uncharacterized protein n=1 Tax=Naegleria lovaniensis TaxID=51637 RepID=A0AA88GDY2_NAELO|nr:uncharacterized protein C9374_012894 [Naegleria lovaniensis]KAG2373048.1 hypothetical protein C9374_012894 [Naegleria lovaniensis]
MSKMYGESSQNQTRRSFLSKCIDSFDHRDDDMERIQENEWMFLKYPINLPTGVSSSSNNKAFILDYSKIDDYLQFNYNEETESEKHNSRKCQNESDNDIGKCFQETPEATFSLSSFENEFLPCNDTQEFLNSADLTSEPELDDPEIIHFEKKATTPQILYHQNNIAESQLSSVNNVYYGSNTKSVEWLLDVILQIYEYCYQLFTSSNKGSQIIATHGYSTSLLIHTMITTKYHDKIIIDMIWKDILKSIKAYKHNYESIAIFDKFLVDDFSLKAFYSFIVHREFENQIPELRPSLIEIPKSVDDLLNDLDYSILTPRKSNIVSEIIREKKEKLGNENYQCRSSSILETISHSVITVEHAVSAIYNLMSKGLVKIEEFTDITSREKMYNYFTRKFTVQITPGLIDAKRIVLSEFIGYLVKIKTGRLDQIINELEPFIINSVAVSHTNKSLTTTLSNRAEHTTRDKTPPDYLSKSVPYCDKNETKEKHESNDHVRDHFFKKPTNPVDDVDSLSKLEGFLLHQDSPTSSSSPNKLQNIKQTSYLSDSFDIILEIHERTHQTIQTEQELKHLESFLKANIEKLFKYKAHLTHSPDGRHIFTLLQDALNLITDRLHSSCHAQTLRTRLLLRKINDWKLEAMSM